MPYDGTTPATSVLYQQYAAIAGATSLSNIPAGVYYAVISIEGNAIRWRDDGTAPTATVGMPVAAGSTFSYTGNLAKIQFIPQAATSTINITYYKP